MLEAKNKILNKTTIIIAFLIVSLLVIIPLSMVLVRSFRIDEKWSILIPFKLIVNTSILHVFLNSLLLGILVVLLTSLIAFPLAFLMAKTDIGRNKWLDLVFIIPFMTPPYVGSMGWILFFQPRGFLDQLFPFFSFLRPYFFSLWGIVFIMSLYSFSFIYLMIKNTLLKISSSLEEAGAVHGGSFWYRMKRIILPLVFSGYLMGALLIFIRAISEFGTPATLGRRVGFYVLTTEINRYVSNWPIDFGRAAAISSVLLGASMLIWYFQQLLSNKYSYSMVGGKGQGRIIYNLGKYRLLAWIYVILIIILSIVIPFGSIIVSSLMKLWGYGIKLNNFTLEYYFEIFNKGSLGNKALLTSIGMSLLAATIAMFLGTFLAIVIVRAKGLEKKIVDAASLISNTVPSIVIIVGLILFWNAPWLKWTFYNTPLILALTYIVLFLPYTVEYVKSSFQQLDDSLIYAARVSGANQFYTNRKIIFPLIKRGMLAGWIMTFIISIRELVGSLMIRPPGMETTSTFIYRQFEQGNSSLGMAMAVIAIIITIIVLFIVKKIFKLDLIGDPY
ncbi:MAG: ABC transporter permease [Halanaerobiaceae bacterium]